MPTSLTTNASERGSYHIIVTLKDEDGANIATNRINSILWSLTNQYGDVMNSLQRTAISPIANPFTVSLNGNDLQIEGNDDEIRHLVIEADYDSQLGDNMKMTDYASFTIGNIAFLEGTFPSASPSPSA